VIVGNVARELNLGATELFECAHRKQLFVFLLNWCRGEAMLQDEQVKRQLMNHLGQTRGAEKKNAYEKDIRNHTFLLQHAACSVSLLPLLFSLFPHSFIPSVSFRPLPHSCSDESLTKRQRNPMDLCLRG